MIKVMRTCFDSRMIVNFSKLGETFVIPIYYLFLDYIHMHIFNALDAFCKLQWVKTGNIHSCFIIFFTCILHCMEQPFSLAWTFFLLTFIFQSCTEKPFLKSS